MDFHTLSRKELQALCKKNKIPANMTNVAMANALADLQQVEGLDEFLDHVDPDAQKFPDEKCVGTPDIHRSASRTSTRRNSALREEPESCKVSTRLQRRTRTGSDEGIDQEKKDPVTPAVPSSRTRAPAVSTRRKKENEKPTEHVPKTPAASSSRVRTTSAYNTRRSVRLLEKNLSKMSLMDTEETGSVEVDEISEEMASVSQQIEDSADTEKVYDAGASSQTVSTEDLEKNNEMEVTSSEKNTGYECQSNDSKSEVQFDSEVTTNAGASLQAEPQHCPGEINESEAPSKDMSSCYEGEPQDSNLKPSLSPEKCYDSDEVSECHDESDVDLTKSSGKEVDANNEAGTEISCDSSESDHKVSPCAKNDASSVEDDASVEATEDKQKEDEHSNMGIDNQNSELMNKAAEANVPQGAVEDDAEDKHKENEHSNVGNDIRNSALMLSCEKKAIEMDNSSEIYVTEGAVEDDASVVVVGDKHKEERSNVANDTQNSELIGAENKAVKMDDLAEVYVSEDSTGKQHEILEDNTYPLMVVCEELEANKTSSELEEFKEFVEKDACSENSVAGTQACIEPSLERNVNVQSVTGSLDSSLARNEAEAEPETIDFQTDKDIEECKENAAAEETLDATNAIHSADHRLSTMTYAPICNKQPTSDNSVEDQTIRNEAEAEPATTDFQTDNDIEECKEHAAAEETLDATSAIHSADQKLSTTYTPICNKQQTSDNSVEDQTIRNEAEAEPETIDFQTDNSTMTDAPICNKQQTGDNSVEDQTIRKMCNHEEDNEQKENLNHVDLHKKSMRELKKMLRNLSVDGKTNKSNNSVNKEVERKRTALQVLPENRMTASNGQSE